MRMEIKIPEDKIEDIYQIVQILRGLKLDDFNFHMLRAYENESKECPLWWKSLKKETDRMGWNRYPHDDEKTFDVRYFIEDDKIREKLTKYAEKFYSSYFKQGIYVYDLKVEWEKKRNPLKRRTTPLKIEFGLSLNFFIEGNVEYKDIKFSYSGKGSPFFDTGIKSLEKIVINQGDD